MGTKKYETSIGYKYYWESLNNLPNFVSYFNQLNEIYLTKPKTVLEIGIGNKLIYNQLKEIGIKTVALDINHKLKPDVVGDIRKLSFEDCSFDTVCAFEVLEHIPFSDFENALMELKRVSKKYVIISIPIRKIGLEFYFWAPIIHNIYFYLDIPYPLKQKKIITDKDCHYWEVNKIGYSKKKIKLIVSKYFKIEKDFRPKLNKYHWFLILKK